MPRRIYRGPDTSPGWINRRFRDMEDAQRRDRSARSLEASSVAGGVVTVQQILTRPGAGVEFRNTDVFTATGPGDLTGTLTYLPKDGSEDVVWGIPQPPTEWTRVGKAFTLHDQDGLIEADDTVEVSYAYEPLNQPPPPPPPGPLTSLTLRGTTAAHSATLTSIPLPAGTQIGDTIVVGSAGAKGWNVTVSDARLTNVGTGAWIGIATDLTDLDITFTGSDFPRTVVATFAETAAVASVAEAGGSTAAADPITLPTVPSGAALAVLSASNGTSPGSIPAVSSTPAYALAVADPTGSGTAYADVAIFVYFDAAATSSPPGDASFPGGTEDGCHAVIIGLEAP